ncbi:trihelix transcription factor ASR3-like [Wolffia australiana]
MGGSFHQGHLASSLRKESPAPSINGQLPLNPPPSQTAAMAEPGGAAARPTRLPRWTRQELLVLIQGKRLAERRRAAEASAVAAAPSAEPKWATVAHYCRRHGVNRGPVQCRKRWSNLAGDYKKIKDWESSSPREPFWAMRGDSRRERKLPGVFDREVYDILDRAPAKEPDDDDGDDDDDDDDEEPEEHDKGEEGGGSVMGKLVEVLERNGRALVGELESQNLNRRLDRDQRRAQGESLVAVLGKVADALGRIADKL